MADRTCQICNKQFRYPAELRGHYARKTPCNPIIVADPADDRQHHCEYCGRSFATRPSMMRHVRLACKAVYIEEAKRIPNHRPHAGDAQIEQMDAKITQLTALVAKLVSPGKQHDSEMKASAQIASTSASTTTIHTVVQNNVVINANNITIIPWDGDKRITITSDEIKAAFAENPKLQEFLKLRQHELTDPETAPPYIVELFTDLTRRAHAGPVSRNIHINPSRTDQVLVCMKTGQWEVAPLMDAMKLIFDGIAISIHRIIMDNKERMKLPSDMQNVVGCAEMVYQDQIDEIMKGAKATMVAHLTNCRRSLA